VRSIVVAICLALVMSGCGGGDLTLAEYAEEAEALLTTMIKRIDDLDAERESGAPTVESTKAYFIERMAARHGFLDEFKALEPPEEAVEMHAMGLDMITQLTASEDALAQHAYEIETADDLSSLWETAEAQTAGAADDEAVAFCEEAQSQFDATAERQTLADFPWIPPELREVVVVFIGCSEEDRSGE
jgi:hypothetical protein